MAIMWRGATARSSTVVVVAVVKFMAGAWIVALLVPSLMILMLAVRRHYRGVEHEIGASNNLKFDGLQEPIVIVPIADWSSVAENALRLALQILLTAQEML